MADNSVGNVLSNRTLGGTFLVLALALIVILGYMVVTVIRPLTTETAIAAKIVESYVGEFHNIKEMDEDTVRFLIRGCQKTG